MKELLLSTLLFMWFFSFRQLFQRLVVLNRFLAFLATVVPTSNRRTHLHGYHHLINSSTSSKASSVCSTKHGIASPLRIPPVSFNANSCAPQRLVIVMTKLSHSVQPFPQNVTDRHINSSMYPSRPNCISIWWYRLNIWSKKTTTTMWLRIAKR